MNINQIFNLLIVNYYLCHLCDGCISSKLTICLFRKFISTKKHSVGKGSTERSLTGIFSLT